MEVLYIRVEELIDEYIKRNSLVLDVGCGTGINTVKLKNKTKNIIGLDVKNFIKNEHKDSFKFVKGDGKKIPFKQNYFDFVTCWDVIEHIKEDSLFLREIFRVLKPGGLLLLSTPNRNRLSNRLIRLFKKIKYPYYLGSNPDGVGDIVHIREYTEKELERLIARISFKVELKEGIYLGFHGFLRFGIYKVPRIFQGLTQHIFMVLSKL